MTRLRVDRTAQLTMSNEKHIGVWDLLSFFSVASLCMRGSQLNGTQRSATAWESPTCIYNPTNAEDVAIAVKVLGFTGAKYAIRGGGHTPLAGWSNIDNGVLITMSNLNDLNYDDSSKTVRVGAGNRWGDIYNYMESFSRLVVGGRVTDVGMGLALGGGLSHFSNQYGFVADNVVGYELVLSDGSIAIASAESSPDLFWALKGGSSNFGMLYCHPSIPLQTVAHILCFTLQALSPTSQ